MIHSLIDELSDISKTLNWEWQVLDEDWSKPSTAKLSYKEYGAEITGDLSLKGISMNLHPECEPFALYFDSQGMLTTPMSLILVSEGRIKKENSCSSVKTQYAPPDVHISIIKLLKYLKKRYIPDLHVDDEGEYWKNGDREKLIEKMGFLNDKMEFLEGILSDIEIENADQYSSEQLAERLEEELRKRLADGKDRPPKS